MSRESIDEINLTESKSEYKTISLNDIQRGIEEDHLLLKDMQGTESTETMNPFQPQNS